MKIDKTGGDRIFDKFSKKTNNLPYDFVVGKDMTNQIIYDANEFADNRFD